MNTRHQKSSEPTAPKILWTASESRSMFCECIWGGGAAPSSPTPLQLGSGWVLKFFFQGIKFFFQGLMGVKPLNFFPGVVIFFFQGLPIRVTGVEVHCINKHTWVIIWFVTQQQKRIVNHHVSVGSSHQLRWGYLSEHSTRAAAKVFQNCRSWRLMNFTFTCLYLGGGNSNIFYFHAEPWGFMIQFD